MALLEKAVEDEALGKYCEEIAESLEQAGLPVRIGGFEGFPQELEWDEGKPFRPEELEGHRQTALVAVLTDGEVLMRHTRDDRREDVEALLGALASWERLAFVDFSGGDSELASLLRGFALPCLAPEALPGFFGVGTTSTILATGDPGELRAWQGAPPVTNSLSVTWTSVEKECRKRWGDVELWRCPPDGHHANVRDAVDWPRRSLAMLLYPVENRSAQTLATKLLYGGSVDSLLLGLESEKKLAELIGADGSVQEEDQLLVLNPTGVGRELTQGFAGPSVQFGAAALDTLEDLLLSTDESMFLEKRVGEIETLEGDIERIKLSYCPPLEATHLSTGMAFVKVCSGSFRMGFEEPDEVEITGFWMAKPEVSNAQFRRQPKDTSKEGMLPKVDVDWNQAREFCQSLGPLGDFDLPIEAQWEYAARGHSGYVFPWGAEEPDADKAVFRQSSPSAVDSLPGGAGPFGTLHQAGNVWEWVLDCYDEEAYAKRIASGDTTDPAVIDDKCSSRALRVLRGGSFDSGPRNLRSAFRGGNEPGVRSEVLGFRCVRRPRLQP